MDKSQQVVKILSDIDWSKIENPYNCELLRVKRAVAFVDNTRLARKLPDSALDRYLFYFNSVRLTAEAFDEGVEAAKKLVEESN
jgi:hypothetical protein